MSFPFEIRLAAVAFVLLKPSRAAVLADDRSSDDLFHTYIYFITVCSCVSVLCLKFGFLSLLPFLLRCLFHVWSEKGERVISPISMLHGASTQRCVSSARGHAQFDPISCVMLTQCDLTQPGLAKLKVAVAVVHIAMH